MPSEVETKSAFASKLNWVGVLLAVWPEVEKLLAALPEPWGGQIIRAVGILIIVLRTFYTGQPVRVGPPR